MIECFASRSGHHLAGVLQANYTASRRICLCRPEQEVALALMRSFAWASPVRSTRFPTKNPAVIVITAWFV